MTSNKMCRCEFWTMGNEMVKNLEVEEWSFLRKMLGIKRTDLINVVVVHIDHYNHKEKATEIYETKEMK